MANNKVETILTRFLIKNEGVFEDIGFGGEPRVEKGSFTAVLLTPFMGFADGMYCYGKVSSDCTQIVFVFSEEFADEYDNAFYTKGFTGLVRERSLAV